MKKERDALKDERDELVVVARQCNALTAEVERLRARLVATDELVAERSDVIKGLDEEIEDLQAGQPSLREDLLKANGKKAKYKELCKQKEKELKGLEKKHEEEKVLWEKERTQEKKEADDNARALLKTIRENGTDGATMIQKLKNKIKELESEKQALVVSLISTMSYCFVSP